MSDDRGWVKIHRQLLAHPLWLAEPFSKGQAFIDLILRAAHQDHERPWRGSLRLERRGQLLTTQVSLAERWKWARRTVGDYLRSLKARDMIAIESASGKDVGWTMITIRNYDKFQSSDAFASSTSFATGSANEPPPFRQRSAIHKNGNNGENGKTEEREVLASQGTEPRAYYGDDGFEGFWSAFPKKWGRDLALAAFRGLAPDRDLCATILGALEEQKRSAEWRRDGGKYVPRADVWLRDRRWESVAVDDLDDYPGLGKW